MPAQSTKRPAQGAKREAASPAVSLLPRGIERWRKGIPWIYRADVGKVPSGLEGGEVVGVVDGRGWLLGQAFYSKQSKIALRWLANDDVAVGAEFFRSRIREADALRQRIFPGLDTYRVIHADADRLPGLIVDRYGEYLSVQLLVKAMDDRKELLADLLVEHFRAKGVINRSDASVRALEGLEPQKEILRGDVPARVDYREGNLALQADLQGGQKTGAFLDQRENHLASVQYAAGEALDCFSYTGAFALQLATAAKKVAAIEISEAAAAQIQTQAKANQLDNVEVLVANAFDFLHQAVNEGRRYDTIVLDPPSFARRKGAVEAAVRGYKEINLRALQLLAPGGHLITASCSHHVSEELFEHTLEAAAADARRHVQILEKRGAARDHPVLLSLPETRYLKCFVLRALD